MNEWWCLENEAEREEARIASNLKNAALLNKKLYIFDQDGTIYLDFEPLPGVIEFIQHLLREGKEFVFITNNSSRSVGAYRERMGKILGIELSDAHFHTSTLATTQWLKEREIKRVYPIGTPEFEEELEAHGIVLDSKSPELVVLAFDTTLTYEKLEKASYLIQRGTDYIATHPDNVCPTKDGHIPDVGSFIALLETATGRSPSAVLGKPNKDMVKHLLDSRGIESRDAIIFGDRLYTDIRMGNDSGIAAVLMLTGESTVEDIGQKDAVPDLVFGDFSEALKLMKNR
jgi:HAD superfamily hydrolase (TIGR01450 family)